MKCPKCKIGNDRGPLYRSTPLGQETVFMCYEHLPAEYKALVPPETKELSELLAGTHNECID